MQTYRITVSETSRITSDEGETTELESRSTGALREGPAGREISYTQVIEGATVFCRFSFKEGTAHLSRRGGIVAEMSFDPKTPCHTVYSIPPYSFDMTINTESVEIISLGGARYRITLRYLAEIGGARQGTTLILKTEERGPEQE